MSSESSSSSVDGSLGADVRDLALFNVETLLFSIGLNVDKEGNNVLDRLCWVSTVVMVDVFAHSMSTWTTSKSSEWNDGFVLSYSLQIGDGLKEVESSACSGSLISVLKMSS
mgnify:CR=1 FL=1